MPIGYAPAEASAWGSLLIVSAKFLEFTGKDDALPDILKRPDVQAGDSVRGTATAASIWLVGALGAAVAARAYDLAIILCLVNYGALRLLYPLKKAIDQEAGRSDGKP